MNPRHSPGLLGGSWTVTSSPGRHTTIIHGLKHLLGNARGLGNLGERCHSRILLVKSFCVRRLACLDSFVGLEGCIGPWVLPTHLGSACGILLAFPVLACGEAFEVLLRPIHYPIIVYKMADAVKSAIYNETLGRKDLADELEKLLSDIPDETQHDLRVNVESLVRSLRAPQPDAQTISIQIWNVLASMESEVPDAEARRLATVANRLLRGGRKRKTRRRKSKAKKSRRRVR